MESKHWIMFLAAGIAVWYFFLRTGAKFASVTASVKSKVSGAVAKVKVPSATSVKPVLASGSQGSGNLSTVANNVKGAGLSTSPSPMHNNLSQVTNNHVIKTGRRAKAGAVNKPIAPAHAIKSTNRAARTAMVQ